jgi:hypothetical protein
MTQEWRDVGFDPKQTWSREPRGIAYTYGLSHRDLRGLSN